MHPFTRTSFQTLTQMYTVQNQYSKAEKLCKRQIEILKKATGKPLHPLMLEPMRLLSEAYLYQGKFSEGEQLFSQIEKMPFPRLDE